MTVVLSALAVYYLTYCITQLDGPGDVFLKLRDKWLSGVFRDAVSCFYCLSVYIAVPFALMQYTSLYGFVIMTFGIAGGAVVIYEVVERLKR